MGSFVITAAKAGLAALVAGIVGASAATAADLGPYRAGPGYGTGGPLAIERWTGFYFGGTLGYASGSTGVDGGSGNFTFDQSGGLGTVFAGYNWQSGSTVLGLEADIGTGGFDGSASNSARAISGELSSFGSVRARGGVLMSPQMLLYATGGLAWGDYNFKVAGADRASEMLIGFQVGAGLEYMIAPQWTMRVEYIYTGLGSERLDHGGGLANTYDPDFHTIRAGIGFKF
jgi:outer membrane immunogenic protein